MVKPESQARPLTHRTHAAERRLIAETEANTTEEQGSLDLSAIHYKSPPKQFTPEEIEAAFLKHYSTFTGIELQKKTTWQSENFSYLHQVDNPLSIPEN
jgi:hypothetical protein